jgi:hypothetical protein
MASNQQHAGNGRELSAQALGVRATAHERRLEHDVAQVRRLVAANDQRLGLIHLDQQAGHVLGFAVWMAARTCVEGPSGPVMQREPVVAHFVLDDYPAAPPNIGLWSEQPLFLGPVECLNHRGNGCFSKVCLFRNHQRRRSLLWYLQQLWSVLTAAELNAGTDYVNREAAHWFIRRQAELDLPLDAPLVIPPADAADPAGDAQRGARSVAKFMLEEL